MLLMVRLIIATLLLAQTVITPPENRYSLAEDVQLGQEAAAEAEKQLPIMGDDNVASYVEDLGRRLVDAIPPSLQHREFRYTFKAVNVRDINAFALPGGPMYVNRGMIEAAHTEGEVAGVMAHEISHVALRHGTAQASKATKYEVGAIAGAVLGAIIGGRLGTVVSEGTRFGLGAYFLKSPREFERQADIEGAQIMARAGYDPVDMANMFKTIETQGAGGPEWLSDHPNPGNRSDYIEKEARLLPVTNPVRDTRRFEQVQSRLKALPKAPTSEEVARSGPRTGSRPTNTQPPSGNVESPSLRSAQYTEGDLFRVRVPSNWRELPGSSAVTFAPTGAYGSVNGRGVFTHGVEIGVARNELHDLQTATDELVASLGRSNPQMQRGARYERTSVGGRSALRAILDNRSEATGREETIEMFTTLLGNGRLFYAIGVAPRDEFDRYDDVFQRVAGSIQFLN